MYVLVMMWCFKILFRLSRVTFRHEDAVLARLACLYFSEAVVDVVNCVARKILRSTLFCVVRSHCFMRVSFLLVSSFATTLHLFVDSNDLLAVWRGRSW